VIKRLKAFVLWLESRFPEKVVVTAESYSLLSGDLERAEREITQVITTQAKHDVRLSALEVNSAHVNALKDLIAVVQALKNDVDAMKVNAGWSKLGAKGDELAAMLNGEVI
jgi:hypothetical protein